jgi:hypothetical protein
MSACWACVIPISARRKRNLADGRLLPGQARDLRGTPALIKGLTWGRFPADRTFDANRVREALAEAGIEAVIPPKSNRTNRRLPAAVDRDTRKWRPLIRICVTKPGERGASPWAAARPMQAAAHSSPLRQRPFTRRNAHLA